MRPELKLQVRQGSLHDGARPIRSLLQTLLLPLDPHGLEQKPRKISERPRRHHRNGQKNGKHVARWTKPVPETHCAYS